MFKFILICCWLIVVQLAKAQTPCEDGDANGFPCSNVDLVAFISNADLGSSGRSSNDIWGWTDPATGREFAIMSLHFETAFVEIKSDTAIVLGTLPKYASTGSRWGDVRTYDHYAYICTENNLQGIQVFDLQQLLTVSEPQIFETTAHFNIRTNLNGSHNLCINEESGYLYVVGSDTCSGGIVFFNLENPLSPTFEGCFAADGYTHDVICFYYQGPDSAYVGREICIASNEDSETFVDVTDKKSPEEISKVLYPGSEYTHQAWITDDHRTLLFDDELDELRNTHNTRTHMINIEDLDNPVYIDYYESHLQVIDHNLFIKGNLVFQSQYEAGLRILDISELTNDPRNQIQEVAFFDTWPDRNGTFFDNGSWGNYPFFKSGLVAVSNRNGLAVVKPQLPHFTLNGAKSSKVVCANQTLEYTIQTDTFAGFIDSIDLEIADLPSGVTGQFSSNTIPAGGTVVLTLDGIGSTMGNYSFVVGAEGRNNSGHHDIALSYVIADVPSINIISSETLTKLTVEYASESMQIDDLTINLNASFTARSPEFIFEPELEVEQQGSMSLFLENVCDNN